MLTQVIAKVFKTIDLINRAVWHWGFINFSKSNKKLIGVWVSQLELIKTTPSGVRGLIGKLVVNELSKVNPTAHTTQI